MVFGHLMSICFDIDSFIDDLINFQYSEVPEIILRCISKDEAALAVAQSSLHVSANLAILVTIRGVSNFCNI